MKKIETLEKAIREFNKEYSYELLSSYQLAIEETGNEYIDFGTCLEDSEIDTISNDLKEVGITTFTISTSFSGLPQTLFLFQEKGFRMKEIVKVNSNHKDLETGKMMTIPAIMMIREF